MHVTGPALVVVAHGTASASGSRTTAALLDAVARARPDVDVRLTFLDVVEPRLAETVAGLDGPAVIVPLLLSTGFHVATDIPAAVDGHPDVRVARHLGPHPLLTAALTGRLAEARGSRRPAEQVALVAAGSSRPEARAELDGAGRLLSAALERPVRVLTMSDDLPAGLADVGEVAVYLLAEGQFATTLRSAAPSDAVVAAPIGVHPALVDLVWERYDEAARR